MKKIFFNNIGLTCDFAEASYIGIRADDLEPRTYFGFIRLMSRWPLQVRALESSGEKNRLGRGPN